MQELDKFNLKINVIPNGLEKYMSFTINKKLSFIDSFRFLSSSLDSLVKNFGKDDSKYFNQEFSNNVWDQVKQKGFCPYEYMSILKNLKKNCLAKKGFIVPWLAEKLLTKNLNMFLMFGINLKWKQWEIFTTCI